MMPSRPYAVGPVPDPVPDGPHTVRIHGLDIRTELALPGLPPAHGPPAMEIRIGPVPAELPGGDPVGTWMMARHGAFLLEVPGVARYLAESPGGITIDPAGEAEPADVRTFLMSQLLPGLLHAHGAVPLRAGAVQVDGGCVLLAGPSAVGKSTLAAGLALRGYPLVSDDVTAVGPSDSGTWLAHPGSSRIRLWEDALDALEQTGAGPRHEWPVGGIEGGRRGHARRLLALHSQPPSQPLPVLGMLFLSPQWWDDVSFVSMAGREKVLELAPCIAAQPLLRWMGDEQETFLRVSALSRAVPGVRLRHPYRLEELGPLLDALEARLSALPGWRAGP